MGIIGSIRKHSWVAVLLVGIAIVAFIIGDLTKQRGGIPDLGKINGTTITAQHFNNLVEEQENMYKMQQGLNQIPSEVEYQIREQVWQSMVEENLLDEQFALLGLQVTPMEMSDMYTGEFIHPYLQRQFTNPQTGQYDYQYVANLLNSMDRLDTADRQQLAELEKYVKKDRQQQKYGALIASGLYMPKAIADEIANLDNKSSNVRVASMLFSSVADEEANPTEQDFQNYYNKHKAEFRIREELRSIEFITYPMNPTPEDLAKIEQEVQETYAEFTQVAEDELIYFVNSESDHHYDSTFVKATDLAKPLDSLVMGAGEGSFIAPHIIGNEWVMAKVLKTDVRPDSLRASVIVILNEKAGGEITRSDAQAKALADSVEALVKSGKMSFEDAVMQYSDDPQKADKKGDQGWVLDGGYGFLNENIVRGAVGSVFTMQRPDEIGYFIVKVTDKTAANKKYRIAQISHEIAPSEATTRNVYNDANHFAGQNRTYAEMIAAAQAENKQVRSAMVRMMDNNIAGIPNARSIVQWAFNEESEIGAVADQVFEANDMYVVVALKDVYKKGYPEMNQIRDMIENNVRIEKKGEILMARAEEAKASCKDINSLAVKLNTTIDTIDSVSYNGYYFGRFGMEPKVQAAVAANKGNNLIGPIKGSTGVYMVQVDQENPQQPNAEGVRAQYEQNYMQKMRSFTQVLKDNATIIDQRNKFF